MKSSAEKGKGEGFGSVTVGMGADVANRIYLRLMTMSLHSCDVL